MVEPDGSRVLYRLDLALVEYLAEEMEKEASANDEARSAARPRV